MTLTYILRRRNARRERRLPLRGEERLSRTAPDDGAILIENLSLETSSGDRRLRA